MIELQELTKRFPGQETPAVDRLSLKIPKGEIVVFVGPSGCGKTTSLKMINRIIEPSSGHIIIDGEDVTTIDPNHLRRRIGYVIQQIGLFPHIRIGDNVATVPQLLGWDKERTARRVDELLEVVGLPPDEYRDRFPKELSGGQRQRVGVARALAADPPVLLMDEPFGAIDPITRTRLQNEFLRLQSELQKTIAFVTHDIDEAVKMGDRIAILQEGSRVAQFATPEEILTNPANEFVADFVGTGATLKRLKLTRVREVRPSEALTVASTRTARPCVAGSTSPSGPRCSCSTPRTAAAVAPWNGPAPDQPPPRRGRVPGAGHGPTPGDPVGRARGDAARRGRGRHRGRPAGGVPGAARHRRHHHLHPEDEGRAGRVLPRSETCRPESEVTV
jgi:osmoprotectant transport system ATP-binding protein